MIGAVLALLICGYDVFIAHNWPVAFRDSVNFLLFWYIATSIAYALIYIMVSYFALDAVVDRGKEMYGNTWGVIYGLWIGISMSTLHIFKRVVSRASLIMGAFLLYQSLVFPLGHLGEIGLGLILIVVGVIVDDKFNRGFDNLVVANDSLMSVSNWQSVQRVWNSTILRRIRQSMEGRE